jgi:hypothetical protein
MLEEILDIRNATSTNRIGGSLSSSDAEMK